MWQCLFLSKALSLKTEALPVGLPATLFKGLQHRRFPVNPAKILRTPLFEAKGCNFTKKDSLKSCFLGNSKKFSTASIFWTISRQLLLYWTQWRIHDSHKHIICSALQKHRETLPLRCLEDSRIRFWNIMTGAKYFSKFGYQCSLQRNISC